MTISLILTTVLKNAEESVSVDLVEGLLKVHEEQAALAFHAENLGDALRSALALLEAVLIELRFEKF